MRVAFNAFFLGQEGTGSGQYSRQLLRALARLDNRIEYSLFGTVMRNQGDSLGSPGMQVLRTPFAGRSENLDKLWFEQIAFPHACRCAAVDVSHVPYFASPLVPASATVVTVHDVIPFLLPAYRGSRWVQLYMQLVAAAARRADRIITDSFASRDDIIRHLRIDPQRVHAIYLAADPSCRPVTDEGTLAAARRRYGLPDRYILYLGGFDQRKNLRTLFEAYRRMSEALGSGAPFLVVAGRLPSSETPLFPDPKRMARELGVEQRIVFTGWVAEEDKPALYSGALLFAFLSLYEGFGLMPLEAMSCGTPVLAARTSSLAEIVGDGGLLVDVGSLDQVVEQMVAVLRDASLRQRLCQNALAQAARFDWQQTARQTLEVYDLAVNGTRAVSISSPGEARRFD